MQLHAHSHRAVVAQQPDHFGNAVAPQQFIGAVEYLVRAAAGRQGDGSKVVDRPLSASKLFDGLICTLDDGCRGML